MNLELFSANLETLVRITEQMLSSPLGSAGSIDAFNSDALNPNELQNAPLDSTQNFCDELNRRQIMPMELMQARSHHRFAEAADKVFSEMQHVRMAVRKTALYVKEKQSQIGKKLNISLF